MNKKLLSTTGLILAVILFISFIIVINGNLKSARIDLTEDKIYTLSEGSLNILESLKEPITLRFFYTEQVAQELPSLKTYALRVQELLEEYQRASDGLIKLIVIDPKPFSENEQRAKQYGLQGVPIETDTMYFGLAADNLLDGVEVIPFFQPEKEDVLEYDLTKLIYKLSNIERHSVAVISPLSVDGEGYDPLKGYAPSDDGTKPWAMMTQLRQLFDVTVLPDNIRRIPSSAEVLILIHPKDLAADTQYAIDQYVLRGGKLIVFVDPYAEVDKPEKDPDNPMSAMMAPRGSNLPELFSAWGFERNGSDIVADLKTAESVNFGANSNNQAIDYVLWQGLTAQQFNSEQAITKNLRKVVIATPGRFESLEGATTTMTPLMSSTNEAMLVDKRVVQFRNNPMALLTKYQPGTISYPVAVRVNGPVKSAFPDGLVGQDGNKIKLPGHLAESSQPIDVIAVADVDLLQDKFWVQLQEFYGDEIAYTTSNNIDFLINALDEMTGSEGLIDVRSRAGFLRPFDRVVALKSEADKRYRTKEQALQKTLKETDQRIARMQTERSGGDAILSASQKKEIKEAELLKSKTQQELREVQGDLRQDIDRLETRLKFFNIGLVPLIVVFIALISSWLRIRKRTRGRQQ